VFRPPAMLFGAILLLAISASALQTAASSKTAQPASSTTTITDQDNGSDVDLSAGGTLIVKLPSNPSTGYGWAVAGDPAPLKLQKRSYQKNTKSHAAGAPGMQILQFSASSTGMGNLVVEYRRSWEYNTPPAKSFNVRVNVR
jgi:inhibitor of cysteine peptidase